MSAKTLSMTISRFAIATALLFSVVACTLATPAYAHIHVLMGKGATTNTILSAFGDRLYKLKSPWGVAVRGDGSVLIADSETHRVLRVDGDSGEVAVFAGTGMRGSRVDPGGSSTQTQLDCPRGVAVSSDGSVLIADIGNHRVLRVDGVSGKMAVFAGTRSAGRAIDKNPAYTNLNGPAGVAVSGDGSVLIADSSNHRVLRVDGVSGQMAVFAGTWEKGSMIDPEGNPTRTQLNQPESVAVSGDGSVLIADTGNHRVLRVDGVSGKVALFAGTGNSGSVFGPVRSVIDPGGDPTRTQLSSPRGVAVGSDGSVLIADSNNHRVLRVDGVSGKIALFVGTANNGSMIDPGGDPTQTGLRSPRGVAVSGDGSVLIADSGNHRVLRVYGVDVGGALPQGRSQSAVREKDTTYGLNTPNKNSSGVSGEPLPTTAQTLPPNVQTQQRKTGGSTVDTAPRDAPIHAPLTPNTAVKTEPFVRSVGESVKNFENNHMAGGCATNAPSMNAPTQFPISQGAFVNSGTELNRLWITSVAADGSVLVADSFNHRVLRVLSDGQEIVIAGTGKQGDVISPGNPSKTRLSSPEGVAGAPDGSVLIADTGNHRVLRVTTTNRVTIVAGTGEKGSEISESDATRTQLDFPRGVAVGGDGSVLIMDSGNHRVLRVARDNRVTVIVGTGGVMAWRTGPLQEGDNGLMSRSTTKCGAELKGNTKQK